MKRLLTLMLVISLLALPVFAKKAREEAEPDEDKAMSAGTFSGLELRSIGPAINSGRVSDFAVHPAAHDSYIAADSAIHDGWTGVVTVHPTTVRRG